MERRRSGVKRRLRILHRELLGETTAGIDRNVLPADSVCPPTAAQQFHANPDGVGLLTDDRVAFFVTEGYCVLPNLITAGEISGDVCDQICDAARADSTFSFSNRAELFAEVSANMNKVLATPTVRGGLESLLGPGYFMPPWNTHLHVNGVGDQYVPGHTGFHADGTDHGPTQSTVRDHRPRQIFGFFYPGDVPPTHGPTAIMPRSQYKTVDRIHPWNNQHEVNSEDLITLENLPEHLEPNWQDGDSSAVFAAADEHRMRVAAGALGEAHDAVEEIKLVCNRGTVVLVHHDLFHRSSRRLPEAWRPLFVLRDCVRMTEPVSGAPSWNSTNGEWQQQTHSSATTTEVAALHQTFWRYLHGEEDRAEPLREVRLGQLVEAVTTSRADGQRVAAAYAIGRTQQPAAVQLLVDLLSHPQEAVRRAAGYGLTVGGSEAVDALVKLLTSAPTVPPRMPPVPANVDEQEAVIPPIAHAIAQLADHACSTTVVDRLVQCSQRAKTEIKAFERSCKTSTGQSTAATEEPNQYQYYVIHRRRTMVECNFAIGHIGQVAAMRNDVAVCVAACKALLDGVCDAEGEPGRGFTSFMTILRVTHSAITNLIRVASTPASAAATPLDWSGALNNLVPEAWSAGEQAVALSGQPPAWAVSGPTASSMRSMVGEAVFRLRAACDSVAANAARREALRLIEGAPYPFELPAPDEPSAFVHHEPLSHVAANNYATIVI